MFPFAFETVVGITPVKPTMFALAEFSIEEFPTNPAPSEITPTIGSPETALWYVPPDPTETTSPVAPPPEII